MCVEEPVDDGRTNLAIVSVDRLMSDGYDNLLHLGRSVREDLRVAFWHVLLNTFAGSVLTPRALRLIVYRAAGMNIQTPKITYGVTFTGRKVVIGRGTFLNHGVLIQ